MKVFLKSVETSLLYLWQLPQNLIGLAYLACCFGLIVTYWDKLIALKNKYFN